MGDIVSILIVLGVALAIVTVVGHGIWVLLAMLFGRRRRLPPSPPLVGSHADRRFCPRCSVPLATPQRPCPVCGWPQMGDWQPDRAAALDAIEQQLTRFLDIGAVDPKTRAAIMAVVAAERERVAAAEQARREAEESLIKLEPVSPTDMPAAQPPARPAGPSAPPPTPAPTPPRVPAAPPDERVRAYAAHREAAAVAARAEPAPVVPPPKRSEAVGRLLAAFMEEKNIRWGELVGGLLIVGSSIALVLSFWSEIDAQPLLKFLLFNGVTAALFGVGLYTDRRWKIRTTSHGVLVIATLLVPLNFLAIAAFTRGAAPTSLLPIAGEVVSLVVFALLVRLAGRIVTPGAVWLLVAGVMVPSLVQLVVRRFTDPPPTLIWQYVLAGVPIAGYVAVTVALLKRHWLEPLDEPASYRVLTFLGIVSAATMLPLALLVYLLPPLAVALHRLSPLVVPCGLPALLTGLFFWQRPAVRADSVLEPFDRRFTAVQTAGIFAGVLGALVMIGAVVVAWPEPAMLLPVALTGVVVFTAVALWFRIPAAHVPAGAALASAWLVAFHLLWGNVGWTLDVYEPMAHALVSAASGHALLPLVGLLGGLAGLMWRLGRRDDGRMIALVAGAAAVASLALVMWFGLARAGDPEGAIWTLAIYTLALLIGAVALDRPAATTGNSLRLAVAWTGMALLLVTLVQAIVYRFGPVWQLERPWTMALLAHATIVTIGFGALRPLPATRHTALRQALSRSALATSLAAAAVIGLTSVSTHASTLAVDLGWLSVVWLALATLAGWSGLFTASQAALVLTIVCGVTAAVETRPWYAAAAHPWLDPWFLEAQGIALALYCLVRGGVRWTFERLAEERAEFVVEPPAPGWFLTGGQLLSPPWPAVDHVIEVALVALVVLVATYAVVPGVAQELAPLEAARSAAAPAVRAVPPIDDWQVAGIDHTHAAGRGAWLLTVATGLTLLVSLWQRRAHWRLGGMLIVAAAACPLLAAVWEPDVAVASALRWLMAGFFLLASIPIWLRHRLPIGFWDWVGREETIVGPYGWTSTAGGPVRPPMSIAKFFHALFTAVPYAERDSRPHDAGRNLLVGLVVAVYAAMGVYVVQAALYRVGLPPRIEWLLPYVLVWALVAAFAGFAIPFWLSASRSSAAEDQPARKREAWLAPARGVLWVMAAAPLVVMFTFAVAAALRAHPLVGPEPGTWFRRIGWDASYGIPLAAMALVLVGHAIHDRSSRFAFSAGLLANVVATIVVMLRLAAGGKGLDPAAWITVAEANAIVSAVAALVWLAAVTWWRRQGAGRQGEGETGGQGKQLVAELAPLAPISPAPWPLLLVSQVALAATLCATFLVPAVAKLAVNPGSFAWAFAAGGPLGWSALVLTVAAAAWMSWRRAVSQGGVALLVASLVAIVALTTGPWDRGSGLSYHVLLAGCCVAAWCVPLATVAARRVMLDAADRAEFPRWSAISARLFAVAAVVLALRALESDPSAPWWTIGALVAIGFRNVWIAWHEARRGFLWIAAVLLNLALSVWWIDSGYQLTGTMRGMGVGWELLWVNVLAAAAMAVVSVWIERRRIAPIEDSSGPRPGWWLGWHRFAAWGIVLSMLLATALSLAADLIERAPPMYMPLGWAAWGAALVTAVACWWDRATRWPVACLYCVGLLAVGLYLAGLHFHDNMFWWALAMALGAYGLASSYLWSRRDALRWYAARFGAPVTPPADTAPILPATAEPGDQHTWLVAANSLLAVTVLALVFWSELAIDDFSRRMIAAYAVGAQALALGMLARGAVRSPLKYASLVYGVLFAVAFGWAWLPTDFPAPWLHRTVVSVVALAAMIVVYGFGLVKLVRRRNDWTEAAQQLVPLLAVLAAVLVFVVMGIETAAYLETGEVPIAWPALVAVLVALVGLAVAALVAALVPGRDPLGLSERGRMAYVYAAEVIVALACLHVRLTMPWLFSGWWMRFWPLVVMGIAFVGVGVGELFDRRRQRVLAEPLQTTGALLPLLPVLGFWVMSSQIHYSLLLLSVGVLYAAMSVMRRSLLLAVLAAVAANGSLWYLLHTWEGLGLLEHPQLWLIPPALCLLAAGQLNRSRLSAEQLAGLRYASAIAIYVSSTADIFIAGVANAPWLPLVLAGISIVGVFAGILLRVRAFLYLGTSFLLVAIGTVIWYAAIEQQRTWILWLALLVTGVLIIALFGLFEKRRDDILRVVDQLKQWEA